MRSEEREAARARGTSALPEHLGLLSPSALGHLAAKKGLDPEFRKHISVAVKAVEK